MIAGIIILVIGISKAFEFNLPFMDSPSRMRGTIKPKGFFTYGIVYAFTAPGFTFPIFFAVILYASLSPGLGAIITMFTYASGVAIPLIVTGVLAAKTNQLVFIKLAQVAPKIHRASGLVLMAAGAYLIYYYYTNFLVTIL